MPLMLCRSPGLTEAATPVRRPRRFVEASLLSRGEGPLEGTLYNPKKNFSDSP